MARTVSNTGGVTVFPAGTAAFVRRRLVEASGVGLMALAAAVAAAVLTFESADPSLNNAATGPAQNVLGLPGAYVADVLVQTFGAAGLVPVLPLAAWGWVLVRARSFPGPWRRALGTIAAMVLLAMAFAPFDAPIAWPLTTGLGGVAGRLALDGLVGIAPVDLMIASPMALAGLAALLGSAALIIGLGLPWSTWRRLGSAAVTLSRRGVSKAPAAGRWFGRVSRTFERREPTLARRSRRSLDVDDDQSTTSEEEVPDPATPLRTGLAAPKAPRTRPGRKAAAARQRTFEFAADEGYRVPPLDLLDAPPSPAGDRLNAEGLQQNARLLSSVLEDFGVRGEIVKVRPGPVITLYELEPAPGTKSARVFGLADDIARSMSAVSVRVAVVPGRNVIGIELPNIRREMVYLRELIASETFERSGGKLTLALGKDIGGTPVLTDLSRMPHLLIAGTTGSGKSVAINTMILSLLYQQSPETCKFILIDPKMLELSVYDGIPHLLSPVVTEPSKAVVALKWTVREMEERYRAMSQLGVRNIAGYNARVAEAQAKGEALKRRVQTGFDDDGRPVFEDQPLDMDPLPFIVVVVDEMADLMLVAGKDIEAAVQRLAQMARAAGIHLIMATQRPSVDVITGTIKANFPTRVSFQVTSKIDSRTILGEQGAEQLLGQGDMLYMAAGGRVTRVHGPFVSDEEVEAVVGWLKARGEPEYVPAVTEDDDADLPGLSGLGGGDSGDELYDEAVALVAREGKASTSFVQRHLQIGYNRAARMIERMEAEGVVSKADRVGRREVLVFDHG